jgi:hypothetical protein
MSSRSTPRWHSVKPAQLTRRLSSRCSRRPSVSLAPEIMTCRAREVGQRVDGGRGCTDRHALDGVWVSSSARPTPLTQLAQSPSSYGNARPVACPSWTRQHLTLCLAAVFGPRRVSCRRERSEPAKFLVTVGCTATRPGATGSLLEPRHPLCRQSPVLTPRC